MLMALTKAHEFGGSLAILCCLAPLIPLTNRLFGLVLNAEVDREWGTTSCVDDCCICSVGIRDDVLGGADSSVDCYFCFSGSYLAGLLVVCGCWLVVDVLLKRR
jgi:hypothetical protein